MAQKKTVFVLDESIITAFKKICKQLDRTPSRLVESWIVTFLGNKKINGKKPKPQAIAV